MVGDGMRRARRIPAMIDTPFSTKKRCAMRDNTGVQLRHPGTFTTDIPQMNYELAVIPGAFKPHSIFWRGLVKADGIWCSKPLTEDGIAISQATRVCSQFGEIDSVQCRFRGIFERPPFLRERDD
jgi:hypothetical protein